MEKPKWRFVLAVLLGAGLGLACAAFYPKARDIHSGSETSAAAILPSGVDQGSQDQFSQQALDAAKQWTDRQFRNGDFRNDAVLNVPAQFNGWVQRMRAGDLDAARILWHALLVCSRFGSAPYSPESYAEMRQLIDDRSESAGPAETMRDRARLSIAYGRCGNVSQEQRALAVEALLLLAESGDSRARLDFAWHGIPDTSRSSPATAAQKASDYHRKAVEFLQAEASLGNPDAFMALAYQHMPAGSDVPPNLFPADSIQALAYSLAAAEALRGRLAAQAGSQGQESQAVRIQLESAEASAAMISLGARGLFGPMSEADIAQAHVRAREILRECCG